jgi:hypothetical protein
MKIDSIKEKYQGEEFLQADGFDMAIIGVDEMQMRLIYSVTNCIRILMEDMPEDEALEYFEHSVSSAYVGEKTPIWCYDYFLIY